MARTTVKSRGTTSRLLLRHRGLMAISIPGRIVAAAVDEEQGAAARQLTAQGSDLVMEISGSDKDPDTTSTRDAVEEDLPVKRSPVKAEWMTCGIETTNSRRAGTSSSSSSRMEFVRSATLLSASG